MVIGTDKYFTDTDQKLGALRLMVRTVCEIKEMVEKLVTFYELRIRLIFLLQSCVDDVN